MRILLAEDNVQVSKPLAEALTSQRYVVDVVDDGEAGWTQSQILDYDLTILDKALPKLDGVSLCRQLRSSGYSKPILMIAVGNTSADKVKGLDAGADDYVVIPFDLPELLARIRALLRRGNSLTPPVLEWNDLRLNLSIHEVTYLDQAIHLTCTEYSLLELLVRNRGRVLSRSLIVDHLWSSKEPPGEETVKTHIKSLRQKLRTVGVPADLIETVYGVGYRLKDLPDSN